MSPAARVTQARKRAYYYIKYTLSQPPWNLAIESTDSQLADKLGGPALEGPLRLLGDGKRNPDKKLVTAFRHLTSGRVLDRDIDDRLVIPFRT